MSILTVHCFSPAIAITDSRMKTGELAYHLASFGVRFLRFSPNLSTSLMLPTKAYATHGAQEPLKTFSFERRDPTSNDVQIDISYCGVCHSDIHIARNEWGGTTYPCVPGHEIVGRVVKVGRDVT